ncbi:hypothetical protein PAECIP111893_04840 [Paenibacillus plantiphilus]|uniref:Uncharacterized protein n=1 Tax=Paenibacillus plantiphilus TaxID=2905650 RepID=A0ABM9CRE6_9BACL|nr:hypothetical protein [Paenibacillus plantiphilus]CAH1222285.1 hypothetical protein PAECIP111893_04840 [Paenibacillus plantiphilus]
MEYFIIEHDDRLDAAGGAIVFPERMLKGFEHAEQQEIVHIKPGRELVYSSIIERPVLLVSNEMQAIISRYEPEMACKTVVVMDMTKNMQVHFSMMELKEIPCTAPAEVVVEKGRIEQLAIDKRLIGDSSMFKITYYQSALLVVRLDLAENLLRAGLYGLRVRRILLKEGEE